MTPVAFWSMLIYYASFDTPAVELIPVFNVTCTTMWYCENSKASDQVFLSYILWLRMKQQHVQLTDIVFFFQALVTTKWIQRQIDGWGYAWMLLYNWQVYLLPVPKVCKFALDPSTHLLMAHYKKQKYEQSLHGDYRREHFSAGIRSAQSVIHRSTLLAMHAHN